ncbi:MAG: hypothetical protein R3F56_06925 [Planctomycetota bacterium]
MRSDHGGHGPMDADGAWLEMTLEDLGVSGGLTLAPVGSRVGVLVLVLGVLGVALATWSGSARGGGAEPVDRARDRRPIDVLFVEERTRWEFRYAKNALLRDGGTRLQVFLLDGSSGAQEHSRGAPGLGALPAPTELGRYRVIVLGDVTPSAIERAGVSPVAFASALAEFVARGGGLAVLAGESMPVLWRGSPLVEVLPVADVGDFAAPAGAAGLHLDMTAAGARHPVLRLGESGACDPEPWRRLTISRALTAVARPGAEILLRSATVPERLALVAGAWGRGHVLLVGTDDLWRVRSSSPELHARFYRSLVAWLAK